MFDEPNEDEAPQRPMDPAARARDKSDEFRMHAEFAAVFEGPRKFDAEIRTDFDPNLAREMQRTIGKLEKSRVADTPVIDPEQGEEAAKLLSLPATRDLPTNDYHVYRRPGEVMIVRWLAGDEVDLFYDRLQAHFDAALAQFREEERQSLEWKQDPQTMAYLEAMDKVDIKMPERYLRDPIRKSPVPIYVLSTQAADELDIRHLCEYVMNVPSAQIVGEASAPPEDGATERDRAWFFKLFSMRGSVESVERMCFFAFLQKADDEF